MSVEATAPVTRSAALRISRCQARSIDEVMRAERLDAILFLPGQAPFHPRDQDIYHHRSISPWWRCASPPVPGFDAKPSPFGVSFAGTACVSRN
jgi:hypothetical protein